jgi:RNA polymerase-binding transcription factor DksA
MSGLNSAEQIELNAIHKALERIERGIFGNCQGCFEAIGAEELLAKPWDSHCPSCRDKSLSAPQPSVASAVSPPAA